MKNVIKVLFWIFSVILAIMALALLSGSALSCALLLGSAVLINPLFVEKVQLKKGLTAVLAIGLFVASVAVFPAKGETTVAAKGDEQLTRQAVGGDSALAVVPMKNANLQLLDEIQTPIIEEAKASTPTPTQKPTPTQTPTQTPKPTPTPTPMQTLKPTPTQEPTTKPTPTQKPTPTAAPITRSIGITILDYSDTVRRGAFAFIEIQGAPNTDYTCDVEYKSGSSSANGLGKKRSDANGVVSWRWKVGSRTSLNYTPTIYIEGGGDSVSVSFEVTE